MLKSQVLETYKFYGACSSYFSQECSSKDGTSAGSCADGFGVCCTCKYTTPNISKIERKCILLYIYIYIYIYTAITYIQSVLVVFDTCGKTSSENLTVWTQPTTVSDGTCSLTICPNEDICSVRRIY